MAILFLNARIGFKLIIGYKIVRSNIPRLILRHLKYKHDTKYGYFIKSLKPPFLPLTTLYDILDKNTPIYNFPTSV